MSEEEFYRRFAERVRLWCRAGRDPFGKEPDAYARGVAPFYWREFKDEGWSPEKCADFDAVYWEPKRDRK